MIENAVAWFDGACVGNPGPMGIGGLIQLDNGDQHTISEYRGYGTNNVAEYTALIEVLNLATQLGVKNLSVCGDSLLVVNQINGNWSVKNDGLIPLHRTARNIMKNIPGVSVKWVRREHNHHADRLAMSALREKKYA